MLIARSITKRFFGKKNLYVWGKSKYLNDKPVNITDKIDGKVSKVGIGLNHMGIVTECGKLYMMGMSNN